MTSAREQDAELAQRLDASVDRLRAWRADPVLFVREVLNAEPDPWQADALTKFNRGKRHAFVACKGPGKTTGLSWLGWNFLATRPHCKVPCASITGDNLKDGLWAEFSKWQKRSPLLSRAFTWTKTRIFENNNPETWFASARTFAQDADPTKQADTLAGLHEDYLLWLLDEVSEMPDGVVSAADAALHGGIETRMAIAGNCTRNSGPLYRAAVTERDDWICTRITGDPDDPRRSPRIDIDEARKQIAKYGRDSYIVKVNLLGEFPDRQADKLIDRSDVQAAMKLFVHEATVSAEAKIIGADVARFGDDAAIFAPRHGRILYELKEFRGLDTAELGDQLIASLNRWDADGAFVDGGGVGGGVIDHCKSRGFGNLVHEVNFGSRALDDVRFENKRAEMYWLAAEWARAGGALPNDPLLAEELAEPIYWYDKKQRICIESKDDIKRRLGRSPDRADGYVLTFAGPIRPKVRLAAAQQRQRKRDYHPFDRL